MVDANHCPGAVQFLFRIPGEPTRRHHLQTHTSVTRVLAADRVSCAGAELQLRGPLLVPLATNLFVLMQFDLEMYVHVGDMRYDSAMRADPHLAAFVGADAVFLDTTYCNPRYVFPDQAESVAYVADTVHQLMQSEEGVKQDSGGAADADSNVPTEGEGGEAGVQESRLEEEEGGEEGGDEEEGGGEDGLGGEGLEPTPASAARPDLPVPETCEVDEDELSALPPPSLPQASGKAAGGTLYLLSTYVIGKEKILTAVARRCGCQLHVTERKLAILGCLGLEDMSIFTTDPTATRVHVVGWSFLGETWPFFRPNFKNMARAMQRSAGYKRVVGFVPTGWTYEVKKKTFSVRRKGPFEIHLVPYSEHSNYDELREYVRYLRPHQIIPTVGIEGSDMGSKAVATMRKHFRNLVDETASKRRFLTSLSRCRPDEPDASLPLTVVSGAPSENKLKNGKKQYITMPFEEKLRPSLDEGTGISVTENEHGEDQDMEDRKGSPSRAGPGPGSTSGQQQAAGGSGLRRSSRKPPLSAADREPTEAASPPVVAFGRGARKRHRQVEAAAMAAPKLENMEVPSERDTEITWEEGPMRAIDLATSCDGTRAAKTVPGPLDELKAILPQSVSRDVLQGLITQAGGDVTKAVSLFFDSTVCTIDLQSDVQSCQEEGHESVVERPNGTAREEDLQSFGTPPSLGPTSDGPRTPSPGPAAAAARRAAMASPKEKAERGRGRRRVPSNGARGDQQPSILRFFDKPSPEVGAAEGSGKALEQLLLVLGASVTADKARDLLSLTDWNVNMAVNLFYSSGDASEERPSGAPPTADAATVVLQNPSGKAGGEHRGTINGKEVLSAVVGSQKDGMAATLSEDVTPALDDGRAAVLALTKPQASEENRWAISLATSKYKPVEHACWSAGEPAPYLHLARTFEVLEKESGRLKSTDMLCNMFRSLLALTPADVLPALYLALNKLAPDFQNVDLNVGGSTVAEAVVGATGIPRSRIRELYTSTGDLGDAAQACRQTQGMLFAFPPLTIQQVFSTLMKISKESGSGSGARKKALIMGLLRACREKETQFLVRTLVQNMRIGANIRTVLPALAQAVLIHRAPVAAVDILKPQLQTAAAAAVEAYNYLPNLDLLVPAMMEGGVEAMAAAGVVSPGTPIKPMLAKITNGTPEVLKRFQGQAFTCEYKYDGQRAQIHLLPGGDIRIFSRNSDDITARFPDVSDIVRDAAKAGIQSFIIDSEVVAVDRADGNRLRAFQHLSTRERGGRDGASVSLVSIKVDVCIFVFDILYVDGNPLVKASFRERRKRMYEVFPSVKAGYFNYADQIMLEPQEMDDEGDRTQAVESFLSEALQAGSEGVMVKAVDEGSDYAAKRSDSWLKVKKDYVEGMHDTLDLVPIGAWFSPFLLACYDPDREEYQSVCRCMSGFTDAFYAETSKLYREQRVLDRRPPYYITDEQPDVWFSAHDVWEMRGADLTVSPVHKAAVGLVHPSRGISMRFPRFLQVRVDKKPEDANTASDVAEFFLKQTRKLDMQDGDEDERKAKQIEAAKEGNNSPLNEENSGHFELNNDIDVKQDGDGSLSEAESTALEDNTQQLGL
eukprot:SM000009S23624  [mRNA]  locus=s9:1126881:1136155:- [translate_table: standard]